MQRISFLFRQVLSVVLTATLLGGYAPATQAADSTYYNQILINGKLQRFSTPVIYYRLDNLENSANWDYTKWSFIKDSIVKQAFADWEHALHGQIMFRETTDPALTDIAVHWRNGFDDRNLLGLEQPRYKGGKFFTDADIEITLTSQGKILDSTRLKAIALHEIGHALGMNGHSPYPGDIMYPAIQPNVSKLSSRDIATIQQIYARTPDITNPQGVHLGQYRQSVDNTQNGMKAFQQKQFNKAYALFITASKQFPSDPTNLMMAGLSAFQIKDYKNTIAHLEKVATLPSPHQPTLQYTIANAAFTLGQQAYRSGNKAQAKQHFLHSQRYLNTVLKNPALPKDMKQNAIAMSTWLTQAK